MKVDGLMVERCCYQCVGLWSTTGQLTFNLAIDSSKEIHLRKWKQTIIQNSRCVWHIVCLYFWTLFLSLRSVQAGLVSPKDIKKYSAQNAPASHVLMKWRWNASFHTSTFCTVPSQKNILNCTDFLPLARNSFKPNSAFHDEISWNDNSLMVSLSLH